MTRLRRMWLWFRRRFNPWLCPVCGQPMQQATLASLAPELQCEYLRAPDGLDLLAHCWRCPEHHQGNNVIAIF